MTPKIVEVVRNGCQVRGLLSRLAVVLPCSALHLGCSGDSVSVIDFEPTPLPIVSVEGTPVSIGAEPTISGGEVIAIDQLPADAELTGVAVTPGAPQLYVLDARRGIFAINDRAASLIFDLTEATATGPDGNPTGVPTELTDLAIAVNDSGWDFVLTAENDGYLVRPTSHRMVSYFCYEPGWVGSQLSGQAEPQVFTLSQQLQLQGVSVLERAEAIAVSQNSGTIFAQPRTLRVDDRAVMGSELFRFEPSGGAAPSAAAGLSDPHFVAGGMTVDSNSRLVLGGGAHLYVSSSFGQALRWTGSIDATITGLALNEQAGELIVLDGPARRLHVLDYAELMALHDSAL